MAYLVPERFKTHLTLPGDIPGLLRIGSPVIYDGRRHQVLDMLDVWIKFVNITGMPVAQYLLSDDLVLDLTDPTGRVHALWWARDTMERMSEEELESRLSEVEDIESDSDTGEKLSFGLDVTQEELSAFRAVCLAVAGRSV